jgi:pyridoxal phosphate enzyme (YggS family)
MYIANEETKFGLNESELLELIGSNEFKELKNIRIVGLMGMASFTNDQNQIKAEFKNLKAVFENINQNEITSLKLDTLSMGMSGDYELAISCGSNMVRIGSNIFGTRNY